MTSNSPKKPTTKSPSRASRRPGHTMAPAPFAWPVAMAAVAAAAAGDADDVRALVNPSDFVRLRGVAVADAVVVRWQGSEAPEDRDVVPLWPSTAIAIGAIQLPSFMLRRDEVRQSCEIVERVDVAAVPLLRTVVLRATSSTIRQAMQTPIAQALLAQHLEQRRVLAAPTSVQLVVNARRRMFELISSEPRVPHGLFVAGATAIHWDDSNEPSQPHQQLDQRNSITFEAVGGLTKQIAMIREHLAPLIERSDIFERYGLKPPRGLLLYGPPGTGKTLLARSVASEFRVPFYTLSAAEATSKYYGETEAKIRDLFAKALATAPSIIFIDELDALCPKRDASNSDLEKRVVATLLTLMDGLDVSSAGHFAVLAATNRPNALDPALRRPGRFDLEIEIGIPTAPERRDILRKVLLQRGANPALKGDEIDAVADICHAYVGADLKALVNEAALLCIQRRMRGDDVDQILSITGDDLRAAVTHVRPSAMRQIIIEVPTVTWDDIGGQDEVKARLREAVEWPLKYPEAFVRLGIRPPKGLLLYGPPGNSKTMMAKALAHEAKLNFLAIKGPELFSKWVGESERAVRELFRKARQVAPSIVFLDEVDALAGQRGSGSSGDSSVSVGDRVLSQLLTELDGIEPLVNVVVVAATNRPDLLDRALLRPGRIDRLLYIGLPDERAREAILRRHLLRIPHELSDGSFTLLAQQLHGYSGAEVAAVCREASLAALEASFATTALQSAHFATAVSRVRPRTTRDMLDFYVQYQQQRS